MSDPRSPKPRSPKPRSPKPGTPKPRLPKTRLPWHFDRRTVASVDQAVAEQALVIAARIAGDPRLPPPEPTPKPSRPERGPGLSLGLGMAAVPRKKRG